MSLLTTTDPVAINLAYAQNNPISSMSQTELDKLRKRLFDNISDLNANKLRLHADEYNQLLNYHHYALTILDNIKAIKLAEFSDPYNRVLTKQHNTINPYEDKLKVLYGRDGKIRFADPSGRSGQFKGEWEKQFTEGVINPPCYMLPPSNIWGLPSHAVSRKQK